MAELAYEIVNDHLEQLGALAFSVEQRLRGDCTDADDIDSAPLTAWRLAQVMRDMTESTAIQRSVRAQLGLDELSI